MATETPQWESPELRKSVIRWLLDSDPSIRWQVMCELMDESHDVVAGERSRVASEGWGSRLLDLQGPDGQWGGGSYVFPGWISTTDTLHLLKDLRLDPACERARRAIGLVRDNWSTLTWKTAPARPAAGTRSAPYECWTGIQHETDTGGSGSRAATAINAEPAASWVLAFAGHNPVFTGRSSPLSSRRSTWCRDARVGELRGEAGNAVGNRR
jgi:hypothetical protein